MKKGKAFEIFIKRLLMNVGFSGIESDGLYIFDGAPGQMIQGLGEAHNADVLLEPPVQTPFYVRTRLLIECKDYIRKVGLNTIRSVLGLREDINHFNIVDIDELTARRCQNRQGIFYYSYERFNYQVAVAALNGYTVPAQKFAATYRIPLLEFDKMPFWKKWDDLIENISNSISYSYGAQEQIERLADEIGRRLAIAITNSGQLLILYRVEGENNEFADYYTLHWSDPYSLWELRTGSQVYVFQLPDKIMELWLENSTNELEMKREAIDCKAKFLSNMIVYYMEYNRPAVKMISIDKYQLEDAKSRL